MLTAAERQHRKREWGQGQMSGPPNLCGSRWSTGRLASPSGARANAGRQSNGCHTVTVSAQPAQQNGPRSQHTQDRRAQRQRRLAYLYQRNALLDRIADLITQDKTRLRMPFPLPSQLQKQDLTLASGMDERTELQPPPTAAAALAAGAEQQTLNDEPKCEQAASLEANANEDLAPKLGTDEKMELQPPPTMAPAIAADAEQQTLNNEPKRRTGSEPSGAYGIS